MVERTEARAVQDEPTRERGRVRRRKPRGKRAAPRGLREIRRDRCEQPFEIVRTSREDDRVGFDAFARREHNGPRLHTFHARTKPHAHRWRRRQHQLGNLAHALRGNTGEALGKHPQQEVETACIGRERRIKENAAEKWPEKAVDRAA